MVMKKLSLSVKKTMPGAETELASPNLNAVMSAPQRLKKKVERDIERHKHLRSSQRQKTFIVSEMTFPDKDGISITGSITELSEGGLTFKPVTNYLEFKENRNIEIHFSGLRKPGIIRSSRPDGYGIQVFEKFSAEEMDIARKSWQDVRDQLGDNANDIAL